MEEEEGGWVERKQLMKTELLLNGGRGEYGGPQMGATKGEDLKISMLFRYNTAKMGKKKHDVVSRHTV